MKTFGIHGALLGALTILAAPCRAADERPNVVILFADDLGYGDLRCYGHPTIRTVELDRMAAEGMRFTQFYSAACVCTPSRAALLTGRLPIRSGMCSDGRRVLFPNSAGGIPASEITLAEALKEQGYATACVGKWHLGHLPPFLPTRNGFDSYFGVPYSNDMDANRETGVFNCPLLRGAEVVERPAVQETLTRRYTEEAVRFIQQSQDGPFFLYFAHTFPHVPLFASQEFHGASRRGLFGDVVEELDWSVGQVLGTLRSLGLDRKTLVFFTSDNGPWLTQGSNGGSAGLLRDGKGSTWDGGMREPALAWRPGTVPAGAVCSELACTLDIFSTCLALAGASVPSDRVIDGMDLRPLLDGTGASPRNVMFFYRGTHLMAVRQGPWKAHFLTQPAYGKDAKQITEHDPPLLFQLERDPSERFDIALDHPEVIAAIRETVQRHQADSEAAPTQLESLILAP